MRKAIPRNKIHGFTADFLPLQEDYHLMEVYTC